MPSGWNYWEDFYTLGKNMFFSEAEAAGKKKQRSVIFIGLEVRNSKGCEGNLTGKSPLRYLKPSRGYWKKEINSRMSCQSGYWYREWVLLRAAWEGEVWWCHSYVKWAWLRGWHPVPSFASGSWRISWPLKLLLYWRSGLVFVPLMLHRALFLPGPYSPAPGLWDEWGRTVIVPKPQVSHFSLWLAERPRSASASTGGGSQCEGWQRPPRPHIVLPWEALLRLFRERNAPAVLWHFVVRNKVTPAIQFLCCDKKKN